MENESIYNRRNRLCTAKVPIRHVRAYEAEYPEKLKKYQGMPGKLYVRGRLPDSRRPSVAIVGARRSTTLGNETARYFARELAASGVQIISGMAWGIDGMAHTGALEAGGDTFAVLGCGVDICYPGGHQGLYDRLLECGGVLSEQPEGTGPRPGFFPARNRIISALSDLVLVVEAGKRSGALITADFALEQGKDVYAVPGRINDPMSRGCLELIKQGAGLADDPKTLLHALGIQNKEHRCGPAQTKILLAKDENIVYSWIRLQPVSLEELVLKTGFPVAKVLSILVGLELKGCIREVQKNEYIRTDLRITNGEISGDSGVTCKGEDD